MGISDQSDTSNEAMTHQMTDTARTAAADEELAAPDGQNEGDEEQGGYIWREESMGSYMTLANALGLTGNKQEGYVQVDSFETLKVKVRRLALFSGFQVKLEGRSDKRRNWKCTSHRSCPFYVVGNRNRYGIYVRSALEHNHEFHVHQGLNQRFTTGSTHELACLVRRSQLYATMGTELFNVPGQQIADCISQLTGFQINQMRASRIKRMLLEDPDRFLSQSSSAYNFALDSCSSSTATKANAAMATSPQETNLTQNEADLLMWECFVSIANDPHVLDKLGTVNVKKMVMTFKQDKNKPILRAVFRMCCPDPSVGPSMTSNTPSAAKFLECYERQVALGFFD